MSLPNGIVCTPEEYERSSRDSSIHCLSRGASIGLTVIAEAGLLSLVAVLVVFLLISWNVIWRVRNMPTERSRVFHKPMDLLMFSLFIADILQAIGGVLNLKWIYDGKVVTGGYCNAQGIIQTVGETGVALSTLVIAAYTLIGVWLKGIQSMKVTLGVLSVIWTFILIVVTVGNTINRDPGKPSFESPSPYWCWISIEYMSWQIFAEYFWLWFTLIFSLLTYLPLFMWMRGNIVLDDNKWWRCTFVRTGDAVPVDRGARRRSLIMLTYPIVYCVTVLPLTIARWTGFGEQAKYGRILAPSAATFFAVAIFGLSGFLNVVLLLTTKPGLFGRLRFTAEARSPSPLHLMDRDQPEPHGVILPQDRENAEEGEYAPAFGRLAP